jgi:formylglycine-generating enzyme required for sulfatase activity
MVTDAVTDVVRERAGQVVDRFERRYGSAMLDFACHSAFPLTLTTDVSYLLRQEYFPKMEWSVAAELLLSSLCDVAGYDLYVVPMAVRGVLLNKLVLRFGEGRVDELARWMARYIQHRLRVEPSGRAKVLGYPSHWTALACLKSDDEATQAIREELGKILEQTDDPSERFRLSALVKSQGDLLAAMGLESFKLRDLSARLKSGQSLGGEWDEWAIAQKIQLVPQVVPIATIRFEDDSRSGRLRQRSSPVKQEDPNVLRSFEFQVAMLDSRGNIASPKTETASYFIEPLGAGVKPLELVAIPGGRFQMGSPKTEAQRESREGPQREVTVPPFFMSKYQVTQAQWRFVAEMLPEIGQKLEVAPARFEGPDNPVERVSWLDVQEFCARVTVLAGRTCRLPSEAEWEYACRAGTTTPFHFGETISPEVANYDGSAVPYGKGKKGEYREKTIPVGSLDFANSFGLYDMHGNVWEWCEDDFHDNYQGAPTDGSARKDASNDSGLKILRGGSWFLDPRYCRSAYRRGNAAGSRSRRSGFRVVYSSSRILS